MNVEIAIEEGIAQVELRGRLDSSSAPAVELRLAELLSTGASKVLVNAASMTSISTAGIRVLLMFARKLAAVPGKLAVFALTPEVHEVLDISGCLDLLSTFPDRTSALTHLKS
jgi:anti-anti-sigma factor